MKLSAIKNAIVVSGICLLVGSTHASAQTATVNMPPKKIIQIGWDQPTTEYVRDHWHELDQKAPFNGLTIEVRFAHNGQTLTEYSIMRPQRWTRQALQAPLSNLQSAKFTKLTNNFIRVNSPLEYIDWFDDTSWNAAIGNVADIAWLAKQATNAQIKGIAFDTETYNAKQYQWRPKSGRSFEATTAQARKRGAQMMKAIGAEYPDITIWSLWLLSKTQMSGDIQSQLPSEEYGLWPAFVNGWLDALPPQAKLVEGMEDAYYFTRLEDFSENYVTMRNVNSPLLRALLSPENRVKYQTQVSIAFGVYLDAFLDSPSSSFYRGPLTEGGSRIERLRQTLSTSLNIADEYVWLYNEQVKWWPIGSKELPEWGPEGKFTKSATTRPGQSRVIADSYPEIIESVSLARDPRGFARKMLSVQNPLALPNLLVNGSFAKSERAKLSGWWDWQREGSQGTIGPDATTSQDTEVGSLRLAGVESGILGQGIDVISGQLYAISGWTKLQGQGIASVRIRWGTKEGVWNNVDKDVIITPMKGDSQNGWQPFFDVMSVPSGSYKMTVLLSAANQQSPEHSIWFDSITLVKLR